MARIRHLLAEAATRLRHFASAHHGVAAMEFALVAPIAITLWFGLTEVTNYVGLDRKLTLLSRTLADLTARATQMTSDDMAAVFAAGTAIVQPYSTTTLKMVVSSVTVTTSGSTTTGKVAWSCASGSGAAKRAAGTSYTVPTSFKSDPSFILVETTVTYTPIIGSSLVGGNLVMTDTVPWPVRNDTQVIAWSGSSC